MRESVARTLQKQQQGQQQQENEGHSAEQTKDPGQRNCGSHKVENRVKKQELISVSRSTGQQQAAGILLHLCSYLVELIGNTFPGCPAPGCELLFKCLQWKSEGFLSEDPDFCLTSNSRSISVYSRIFCFPSYQFYTQWH